MSVESLLNKDVRIAELVMERSLTPKLEPSQQNVQTIASEKESLETARSDSENLSAKAVIDNDQVKATLEQINTLVPIANTRLIFEFDELGDPPIIKVIDKTSNELIREIPSQDLLKVAKAFSEMAENLTKAGALINFQA